MECYNCGAPLTGADYCAKCGADVRIYKKILSASNSFYNEGLERASVRDLSGAIECLKKSLQLNKMNTDARNLLGLVYFEMGETVSALGEWVISKSYKGHDNAAGQYLNEIQNNPARLDSINQTIKKYNQVLIYCKQDSKDLAVIQLKKVLSLNPKLVRGHQLLALLYMEEGRYDQAAKALKNAAKIDENNTTTLRYQKEVSRRMAESAPSRKQKKEDLISYQSGNDTVIMPTHFKDTSALQTVINIVIGVALGVAISMFLLMPGIRQRSKSEANEAMKTANDTISTKEQTISSLENQVEDLTKEAKEAKSAQEETETKFRSYEQLLNAYASYAADDMEAAGAALSEIKADDLNGSAKSIFDDINAKVNEKYLAALYQEGYTAYSRGDYKTAIEKLGKAVEMDETYKDGYTVYYLAQSYRREDNMEQAVIYYQKVLEQCPGTERARVAQTYVKADDENQPSSESGRQGSGQSEGQQPEAGQPGGQQPEAGQPGGQQPEAGQPEGQQPEGQPIEGQPPQY